MVKKIFNEEEEINKVEEEHVIEINKEDNKRFFSCLESWKDKKKLDKLGKLWFSVYENQRKDGTGSFMSGVISLTKPQVRLILEEMNNFGLERLNFSGFFREVKFCFSCKKRIGNDLYCPNCGKENPNYVKPKDVNFKSASENGNK